MSRQLNNALALQKTSWPLIRMWSIRYRGSKYPMAGSHWETIEGPMGCGLHPGEDRKRMRNKRVLAITFVILNGALAIATALGLTRFSLTWSESWPSFLLSGLSLLPLLSLFIWKVANWDTIRTHIKEVQRLHRILHKYHCGEGSNRTLTLGNLTELNEEEIRGLVSEMIIRRFRNCMPNTDARLAEDVLCSKTVSDVVADIHEDINFIRKTFSVHIQEYTLYATAISQMSMAIGASTKDNVHVPALASGVTT